MRIVIDPQHYNKSGLKGYLFMPPKGKTDVSLSRLRYSTENKIKERIVQHIIKPGQTFTGFAILNVSLVEEVNRDSKIIKAKILGTPMRSSTEYVPHNERCFSCDKGLPFHADLIYSEPVPDGEPATDIRKYADMLLTKVIEKKYFIDDPCGNSVSWCGKSILSVVKNQSQAA